MTVAADSSPLILYARAGRWLLLRETFGDVWIPPAVSFETHIQAPQHPGATDIAQAMGLWLHEHRPTDSPELAGLMSTIGKGEAEAIALSHEHGLVLVIDDLAGRRVAQAHGVTIIGSAGVLGLAKSLGRLPMVQPVLDDLLRAGLRLLASLYRQILVDAGED